MKKNLAFVLGGGGSRGALQVGALQALFEAGICPDILVGTSIGAVNSTFLAVHDNSFKSIQDLCKSTQDLHGAWKDALQADLLPANYLWLTVRALFNRSPKNSLHRMRDYFVSHGLSPEIKFKDIQGVHLYLVATDLNSGKPIVFGRDPEESVLESLLASVALPPWVTPIEKDGMLLVDGGFTSNLPIQSAIQAGAKEIIAMNLDDMRDIPAVNHGFGPFLTKVVSAAQNRQVELERELAKAYKVEVHYVNLLGKEATKIWDFHSTDALVAQGYAAMSNEMEQWQKERKPMTAILGRIQKKLYDSNIHRLFNTLFKFTHEHPDHRAHIW